MTELILKFMLVGDSDVGKSSLMLRYVEEYFLTSHLATIGLENKVKILNIRNFIIKLQVWDTAGQERFRSLTRGYFRNADGILFVFDITKKMSFENVKEWIEESEGLVGPDSKRILLGNKSDEEQKRDIDNKQVEEFCNTKNLFYIETSAKNNSNVDKAFEKLVELIIENKTEEELIDKYGIKEESISKSVISNISVKSKKEKKSCC